MPIQTVVDIKNWTNNFVKDLDCGGPQVVQHGDDWKG